MQNAAVAGEDAGLAVDRAGLGRRGRRRCVSRRQFRAASAGDRKRGQSRKNPDPVGRHRETTIMPIQGSVDRVRSLLGLALRAGRLRRRLPWTQRSRTTLPIGQFRAGPQRGRLRARGRRRNSARSARRLLSQRPQPAVRAARSLPLVHRRRHDPRLLRRRRQGQLPQPLCPHAEVAARARGGQGAVRRLRHPRAADPSVMGKDSGVANTNIVWHAGRLLALEEAHKPFELDPAQLEFARLCRAIQGARHRASQDRSRDRRDGLVRLLGRASAVLEHDVLWRDRRERRVVRREDFEAPLFEHGARLPGHASAMRCFPILPLTGEPAAGHARRPGLRLGAGQGRPRRASWRATPASRRCAGSPPTPATCSIR